MIADHQMARRGDGDVGGGAAAAAAGEEQQQQPEEVEDVSDEACVARHDRSELEERRKFMSYLKQPAGMSRGRRRVDQVDSRAESSGANTPTEAPLSPHLDANADLLPTASVKADVVVAAAVAAAVAAGGGQQQLDAMEGVEESGEVVNFRKEGVDETASQQQQQSASFSLSAIKERRRTVSLTKKDSVSAVCRLFHDDNSAMSWDLDEVRVHTSVDLKTCQLI